jgi:Peptidase family M28
MAESVQETGKRQAGRRRRVRGWLLLANIVVLSLLAGLWAMLTQPLIPAVITKPTSPGVSADHLRSHVRMLSETLVPRDYRHPENLDRVAEYLRRELESSPGKVSEQAYQVDGRTYRNVIARFGPEMKERIIIGAHYDTCQPYPGADDNASGVAGLIELARLLGQTPLPLTVELVAYTLEEPPYFRSTLMGSAVHTRALKAQGVDVRHVLTRNARLFC